MQHNNNFVVVSGQGIPCYKKALYWICGIENMSSNKEKARQRCQPIEMDMDIHEDPCKASIINIVAVVLMIGTAFMWGYYA